MQYGFNYKVRQAVSLIQVIYIGEPMVPWRLPCEYEAQLISKKVAISILGDKVVLTFAEQKIMSGNDPEKWRFFMGLDLDESFDLLERTKPWVNKYRQELIEKFPTNNSEEPDFTKDNWWE
jgi:hypothetical protein